MNHVPHVPHVPFAQLIGVGPGGVEWVAYKPEHVELMKANLERRWDRWNNKVVRVRGLTPRQAEWVEFALVDDPAMESDGATFKLGATYVEAERWVLQGAADYLDGRDVECSLSNHVSNMDDMNKYEFAVRQAEKCLEATIKKLRSV
jgi:hypothetical protein